MRLNIQCRLRPLSIPYLALPLFPSRLSLPDSPSIHLSFLQEKKTSPRLHIARRFTCDALNGEYKFSRDDSFLFPSARINDHRQMHVLYATRAAKPNCWTNTFFSLSSAVCSVPVHGHNRIVFYSKQSFCLPKQCRYEFVFVMHFSRNEHRSLFSVATIGLFRSSFVPAFRQLSLLHFCGVFLIMFSLASVFVRAGNGDERFTQRACAIKRTLCGDWRQHPNISCVKL